MLASCIIFIVILTFNFHPSSATTECLLGGLGESCAGGLVIDLSGGVFDYAELTFEMKKLVTETDKSKLEGIYSGVSGNELSLKQLGTSAPDNPSPLYTIYIDCFNDIGTNCEEETEGKFDKNSVENYADTLVMDLVQISAESRLIGDAVLVMNVWMRVYEHLYSNIRLCNNNDSEFSVKFAEHLDSVAILWIGIGQQIGSSETGFMLYNLAETAGFRFDVENGIQRANNRIVDILSEMKNHMNDMCHLENLHIKTRNIVAQMNIPLVQNLIHYMWEEKSDFVELYALALLPQVRACSYEEYKFFLHAFILNPFKKSSLDASVPHIQKMLGCLGISCEEIGSYLSGTIPVCSNEIEETVFFRDYKFENDALTYAKSMRDVYQYNILEKHGLFNESYDLFLYGQNMVDSKSQDTVIVSIDDLLTESNESDKTPFIEAFVSYYGYNDYVEKWIGENVDDKKRSTRILQTVTTPHLAIRKFFGSIQYCKDNKKDEALESWMSGVALLVGTYDYVYGKSDCKENLSYYTATWYELLKEMCRQFIREDCSMSTVTALEESLYDSIDKGISSIQTSSCLFVEKSAEDLDKIILAPIIQGTIYFADLISANDSSVDPQSIVSSKTFARAILPVVDQYSSDAANNIKKILITRENVENVSVLDALRVVWPMMEIPCEFIGYFKNGQSLFCDITAPPTNQGNVEAPTSTPTTQPSLSSHSDMIHSDFFTNGKPYNLTYYSIAHERAKIALDIRDILVLDDGKESDLVEAKNIYENGKHSLLENSENSINTISLKILGSEVDRETFNPLYYLYRFALRNKEIFTQFLSDHKNGVDVFPNVIVTQALDIAKDFALTHDSIVAITIRMQVISHLYRALAYCKNAETAEAEKAIDVAFAYYVGVSQRRRDDDGYLFYAFAQRAAKLLESSGNKDNENSEAPANSIILKLLSFAKDKAGKCVSDTVDQNWINLRTDINMIISAMNLPLVQFFIHHLKHVEKGFQNFTELYGLSILPQIATCNPSLYDFFTRSVIEKDVSSEIAEDILTTLKTSYSCLGIACFNVHGYDSSCVSFSGAYGGYVPSHNVDKYSFIDRDVLKIDALMAEQAFDLANDIYEYGYSSRTEEEQYYLSLKNLAEHLNDESVINKEYNAFIEYYNESQINNLIADALTENDISLEVKRETLRRSFQVLVLYFTGIQFLHLSVRECSENSSESTETALKNWDKAAAFLIGSLEGPDQSGDSGNNGISMYALSKELCPYFESACTGSGNSKTNEFLLGSLQDGVEFIKLKECTSLQNHIDSRIVPLLSVSLIQGIIHFAAQTSISDSSQEIMKNTAYIVSHPINALVNSKSSKSVSIIKNNVSPPDVNFDALTKGLSDVIDDLNVNCENVGVYPRLNHPPVSLCSVEGAQKNKQSEGTSLSGGLYVTSTYVEDRAKIDIDVRDMIISLQNGTYDLARSIYFNGLHSQIWDSNGENTGSKRSLAQFSLKAKELMSEEPTFNFFRFTFKDIYPDPSTYGDILVTSFFPGENLLQHESDPTLAADAAVALNLWAYVVHKLHQTVTDCTAMSLVDKDGVHAIDEVGAYWIGYSQQTGDSKNGYLLYRLAEKAGEMFGQEINGQAKSNSNILHLLKQAAIQLSFPNACLNNPSTSKNLRHVVNKIISQMTVPLIQHLIANMVENNQPQVMIYAHAVVPLTSSCSSSTFLYLKKNLITNSFDNTKINDIIRNLQTLYSCLGLKCEDIGIYKENFQLPSCFPREEKSPLAGYIPASDVREFADIDLDVHQIDIMMQERAFNAAKDIYMYGRNSIDLTLHQLATANERSIVPSFPLYVSNFDDNEDYANKIVLSVLNDGLTFTASSKQKQVLVSLTLTCMISFMAVSQKLYQSVFQCKDDSDKSLHSTIMLWDEAAALMIGSLEGTDNSGSTDGVLLHGLSKQLCSYFTTCEYDNSKLNDKVRTLLYAGRAASKINDCVSLSETAIEIENHLLIPMIQGSLLSAVENNLQARESLDEGLAKGYIYSESILPYLKAVDTTSSNVIKDNLEFTASFQPVEDGYTSVFRAFESIIDKMRRIDCKEIGFLADVGLGLCPGIEGDPSSSNPTFSLTIVTFTIMLAFTILAL